ncbi:MAG: 50S ribosome-binding GTPase, partial [Planctomycetes bacterium]|nr:50S ribosome-binding GTPase [Planctomycetota bacterium]
MGYVSVAIVGRPNVGKSTLFNALAGSRIAIEADSPGVTRDRVLSPLTIEDRTCDLVDPGGIGSVASQ